MVALCLMRSVGVELFVGHNCVDFSSKKILFKNITHKATDTLLCSFLSSNSLFQNNKHLRVHDDDDDSLSLLLSPCSSTLRRTFSPLLFLLLLIVIKRKRERKGFVATSRFRFYRGGYSCLLLCTSVIDSN